MSAQDTTKDVFKKIRHFMSVPRDNPELLKAQYRAFSRQLPLMYFILLTNTWALAVSHHAVAPIWLTVYCPAGFTALCGLRVIGCGDRDRWCRPPKSPFAR